MFAVVVVCLVRASIHVLHLFDTISQNQPQVLVYYCILQLKLSDEESPELSQKPVTIVQQQVFLITFSVLPFVVVE